MVEQRQVCGVRKPAPQFKAAAWCVDKVKTVSLADYKGKSNLKFFIPMLESNVSK